LSNGVRFVLLEAEAFIRFHAFYQKELISKGEKRNNASLSPEVNQHRKLSYKKILQTEILLFLTPFALNSMDVNHLSYAGGDPPWPI